MATFFLVRHGETDWNKQFRYQGSSDQPLNTTGEAQAKSLQPVLEQTTFTAIYSSPMLRVRQTAELALSAAQAAAIQHDERLREVGFGKFEGLTQAEIEATYPTEFATWWADRNTNPHDGDLQAAVIARVQAFWDQTRSHYMRDDKVLIFAHGGILGILLCIALEADPSRWWRFRFHNCAISQLQSYERINVLTRLNDIRHLPHEA